VERDPAREDNELFHKDSGCTQLGMQWDGASVTVRDKKTHEKKNVHQYAQERYG
jgi:hypothetical protein